MHPGPASPLGPSLVHLSSITLNSHGLLQLNLSPLMSTTTESIIIQSPGPRPNLNIVITWTDSTNQQVHLSALIDAAFNNRQVPNCTVYLYINVFCVSTPTNQSTEMFTQSCLSEACLPYPSSITSNTSIARAAPIHQPTGLFALLIHPRTITDARTPTSTNSPSIGFYVSTIISSLLQQPSMSPLPCVSLHTIQFRFVSSSCAATVHYYLQLPVLSLPEQSFFTLLSLQYQLRLQPATSN